MDLRQKEDSPFLSGLSYFFPLIYVITAVNKKDDSDEETVKVS